MPDDATKRCSDCKQLKSLDAFNRNRAHRDGLDNLCRDCARDRYQAQREARVAYMRQRYQDNREARAEEAREYRQGPAREAILEAQRQRYQTNRDAELERMRQAYQANREARLEYARDTRTQLRMQVFGHYGYACACCSATENLSIDHVRGDGAQHRLELYGDPRRGGMAFYAWLIKHDFPSGYQTLCMPCNASKRQGERCGLHPKG